MQDEIWGMDSKVSIIIPCYNAGIHLCEAVQSALAQTHPNVEVIIVDDGSTDIATQKILKEAQWPRTRVIHQPNAGPAAARNKAVSAAAGVYILPLDADDVIEPEYVAKGVAILDTRPNVGVVYCKAKKFGDESGPWNLPAYTLRELVVDNVIFVTALYRKKDWEIVGGYNENLRHGVEDYDFWVKIVSLGRDVVQLDEYLFNYRIQAQSRTKSFNEVRANMIDTYAEIFRSNIDFYSKNAHYLFEHRFGLYDELQHWRARYGRVERYLVSHPELLQFLKRMRRIARALIGRYSAR